MSKTSSAFPAGRAGSVLGKNERDVFIASLFAKVLLFPAYRSTDFEVHRNWLAITKSLPLSRWYYDATSEWTLDYPPFFAFFERILSGIAYLLDPTITTLSKEPIATWPVIGFQRSSVIVSELVLGLALYRYIRNADSTARIIAVSLFLHPGLIFVDSIHFQYNGMLLGILLLSLVAARDNNLPACAFCFAVLLNFKHIFVYLAPPYLVYLFRAHCFSGQGEFYSHRFVQLATIVGGVCAASFLPFLLAGGFDQIRQIISRLFPFQRGLNHAYWAGNVWAIYSAVDRVLVKYLQWRGLPVSQDAVNSASRGLIGDITFGVLPEIKPVHCFLITLAFNAVYLTKLWQRPTYKTFLKAVTLSAFTSFLFGFHVHEKAILLVLFPLSLLALEDHAHYRVWLLTTAAGTFALFPLLISSAETPIKLIYTSVWCAIVFPLLSRGVYRPTPTSAAILLEYAETLYLYGLPVLQALISIVFPMLFNRKPASAAQADVVNGDGSGLSAQRPAMEFLPLMVTSVYCAIGIIWSCLKLSYLYTRARNA